MSRIGMMPVNLPDGVEVFQEGSIFRVKGANGELQLEIIPYVNVSIDSRVVKVSIDSRKEGTREYMAKWGLFRSLVNNMVIGVSKGFVKELEMKGIGYRAQMIGEDLQMNVGFSHPVIIKRIPGIKIEVKENTNILVSGIDKQLVGQVSANIRKIRKPEPYKGKGIRYKGEIVRMKSGKKAKK